MSIIRFEDVDVIFTNKPREALSLLAQGQTPTEVAMALGFADQSHLAACRT